MNTAAQLQIEKELGEGIALFPQYEIGAFVLPIISKRAMEDPVGLTENGILDLFPLKGEEVTGFRLGLIIPKEAQVVVVQRNLSPSPRKLYQNFSLKKYRETDLEEWLMVDHIQVFQKNGTFWTVWKAEVPNRVDLWFLMPDGLARLFQVGVVARGTKSDLRFQLLGELRGEWQLYFHPQKQVVGKPTDPVHGSFDVRRTILSEERFKALLAKTRLEAWRGSEAELNPPLVIPAEPKQAMLDWWSPFTGRRGQGPIAPNGSDTWVCGEDVIADPDPDGIVRLPRGTVVSYKNRQPLGEKDWKLVGVRRAS